MLYSIECVGFLAGVWGCFLFFPPACLNKDIWTHSLKVDVTSQNHIPPQKTQIIISKKEKTVTEVIEEKIQSLTYKVVFLDMHRLGLWSTFFICTWLVQLHFCR